MNGKKIKLFKTALTIISIMLIIIITIYLIPVIRNISTTEGQIKFKTKVEQSGILGLLMLFGLQFAQIFLFILPGEPIEVLAGMCYGTIKGCIFIDISAAIISSIIIVLVKKYGRKFIYEFNDKEKIEKIEKSKLFNDQKKIEMIMMFLFLIPGTPKDLLVYLAGILPINHKRFILTSTIARIPSIITSTYAGANLAVGDWKTCIKVYAITFIFLICIYLVIRIIRKLKKHIKNPSY